MAQPRLSRGRSFSSQALVWSQSPCRQARMWLLVDHEHRIVICQMLDDIVAHDIAQGIRIPVPATKDRLLPPWTRIASSLRPHPAGLALLIAEQTFQKQACVPRDPFLPEQWTYPLLNLPKRRSPQRKRLFNRHCPRPRSSNHGCPWIQKSSERATVMLGLGRGALRSRIEIQLGEAPVI